MKSKSLLFVIISVLVLSSCSTLKSDSMIKHSHMVIINKSSTKVWILNEGPIAKLLHQNWSDGLFIKSVKSAYLVDRKEFDQLYAKAEFCKCPPVFPNDKSYSTKKE